MTGCVGPRLVVVEVNSSVGRVEGVAEHSARSVERSPVTMATAVESELQMRTTRRPYVQAAFVRPVLTKYVNQIKLYSHESIKVCFRKQG